MTNPDHALEREIFAMKTTSLPLGIATIALESTFNWYWLVDGLQEAGHVVHLANTAAMQPYSGLKHGDDRSDARHLAHLLRLGILPTGFIYPRQQRAASDLARHRMRLVQTRSRAIIAVENVLSCHTGGRLSSNQIKRLGGDDIDHIVACTTSRRARRHVRF